MMIEQEFSRSRFLQFLAKAFAIAGLGSQSMACYSDKTIPALKGISESDYLGFKGIQKLFLDGNPIEDFDLGLALDNYVYGHPYPIETEDLIRFLASIPNSSLMSLVLDFSLTPLAQLDKEEMEKRVLGWKNSSLAMKRGLYSILRQFSFFLLTSDKKFQQFMGYNA